MLIEPFQIKFISQRILVFDPHNRESYLALLGFIADDILVGHSYKRIYWFPVCLL
jgi:hypothetical protein